MESEKRCSFKQREEMWVSYYEWQHGRKNTSHQEIWFLCYMCYLIF